MDAPQFPMSPSFSSASTYPSTPPPTIPSVLPPAPPRPTVHSIAKKDKPVNPNTEEPIMKVLTKHNKECKLTDDVDAKTFLETLNEKSGIYMISGDDYHQSPDVLMKIGKAKDLNHRLRQYFFCYPGGFYIYGVILTLKLPVIPKATSAHQTEQTIHAYLRHLNLNILQKHGRSGEWFLIQAPDVQKVFLIALSVASETGFANPPPYCYAFFPPLFVKEYKTQAIKNVRAPMESAEATKLEATIKEPYRMTTQDPKIKGERQLRGGVSRPYSQLQEKSPLFQPSSPSNQPKPKRRKLSQI